MDLSSRQSFVAVLVVGLLGTGLLVRGLNMAGHFTAGVGAWIVGYGGTVLVLWYGWVRPLDLSGPASSVTDADTDPETPEQE